MPEDCKFAGFSSPGLLDLPVTLPAGSIMDFVKCFIVIGLLIVPTAIGTAQVAFEQTCCSSQVAKSVSAVLGLISSFFFATWGIEMWQSISGACNDTFGVYPYAHIYLIFKVEVVFAVIGCVSSALSFCFNLRGETTAEPRYNPLDVESGPVEEVRTKEELDSVIAKSGNTLIVVDFYATW